MKLNYVSPSVFCVVTQTGELPVRFDQIASRSQSGVSGADRTLVLSLTLSSLYCVGVFTVLFYSRRIFENLS